MTIAVTFVVVKRCRLFSKVHWDQNIPYWLVRRELRHTQREQQTVQDVMIRSISPKAPGGSAKGPAVFSTPRTTALLPLLGGMRKTDPLEQTDVHDSGRRFLDDGRNEFVGSLLGRKTEGQNW
jgi:hypothetical protein